MANAMSLCVMQSNAIFFGKNCRIRSFIFSFAPRSHEEYGWAKKNSASKADATRLCWANSLPLSVVSVCPSGSVLDTAWVCIREW
jgi:hypothetical protein